MTARVHGLYERIAVHLLSELRGIYDDGVA